MGSSRLFLRTRVPRALTQSARQSVPSFNPRLVIPVGLFYLCNDDTVDNMYQCVGTFQLNIGGYANVTLPRYAPPPTA